LIRRTAFLWLLSVLLSVCGAEIADGQSSAKKKGTHTRQPGASGSTTPRDPVVIDKEGFRQVLEKHRGKPVLVNFWATWCEPCRDEYPMINELARIYAPQGLVVLAVSLDEDTDVHLVRQFLARIKPGFPSFRKKPGKDEEFINSVQATWSGAIPATFFYDREGRLAGSLVGEHKRPEFERIIRQLVNAARPNAPVAASSPAPEKGTLSCC
jgi:thiol-disulfide isomerase/thioredoxin